MSKQPFRMPLNFISNIKKEDHEILLQAAKATGTVVSVRNSACDGGGYPMKECMAVFTGDSSQDHTDMWIAFNELKNPNHYKFG